MTRITIDDVDTIQDLYDALAAVTQVFTDPDIFESEAQYFGKSPEPQAVECPGEKTQETMDIEPPRLAEGITDKVYAPCPRRGTHHRLSECWACWCDVQRGACLEVDVLAPEAWDVALDDLVTSTIPPRPGVPSSAANGGDGFERGGEHCVGM